MKTITDKNNNCKLILRLKYKNFTKNKQKIYNILHYTINLSYKNVLSHMLLTIFVYW